MAMALPGQLHFPFSVASAAASPSPKGRFPRTLKHSKPQPRCTLRGNRAVVPQHASRLPQ
eukprot:1474074-Rhodomonas_salina.4